MQHNTRDVWTVTLGVFLLTLTAGILVWSEALSFLRLPAEALDAPVVIFLRSIFEWIGTSRVVAGLYVTFALYGLVDAGLANFCKLSQALISTNPPFSLRGLRIGSRDDFVRPFRVLLLWALLSSFYQIVSGFVHLSATRSPADGLVKLILAVGTLRQFCIIQRIGRDKWDHEAQFKRFEIKLNQAMSGSGIDTRSVKVVAGFVPAFSFVIQLGSWILRV